jgi:hypothetical protein
MSKRRNSRVEQEINEILERKSLGEPDVSPPNRRYRSMRQKLNVSESRTIFKRIPPGILWLAGVFGFALLAILISDWSRNLAILFGIISVLIMFSPLVFWSRPTPIAPTQKEWRGRVIQMPPRQDGAMGKLKYKIWELRNRSR